MSALQQFMLSGKPLIEVSGFLSGAGNLNIPAGVTSITLLGYGSQGTDVYNSGQSYIAPTDEVQARAAVAGFGGARRQDYLGNFIENIPSYNFPYMPSTVTSPSLGYISNFAAGNFPLPPPPFWYNSLYYDTFVPSAGSSFVQYAITPSVGSTPDELITSYSVIDNGANYVPYNPGQPYIAPYYTYTTGQATTCTIQGVTRTWVGHYGSGFDSYSNQSISGLNGSAQSLSYNCGPSGSIQYSYTY